MYKPYSLYTYGQVDGRITFQYKPWHKRNVLLMNIRQMDILWNRKKPDTECILILLSFDPHCRLSFDARYFQNENGKMKNENFESVEATVHDCIRKGQPVVFEIDRGTVTASPLDPEEFNAKY